MISFKSLPKFSFNEFFPVFQSGYRWAPCSDPLSRNPRKTIFEEHKAWFRRSPASNRCSGVDHTIIPKLAMSLSRHLWIDQFLLLVSSALHTETEYREHSLHHNIRTSAWLTWLISRDGERREFGYWSDIWDVFILENIQPLCSYQSWDETNLASTQYWQWLRKIVLAASNTILLNNTVCMMWTLTWGEIQGPLPAP